MGWETCVRKTKDRYYFQLFYDDDCHLLCLQYYGHRHKMGVIGREDELEKLNLTALKLARDVADRTGTLMAGNLCNSAIYDPDDAVVIQKIREMFIV